MEIHNLDRANMPTEYGVQVQRLLPWDSLNAPFEAGWCVVTPGTATEPHSHHEYEIFVAVAGSATIEADGESSPFVAGDVAYMQPGSHHTIINDSDRDFEFYSVWWDQDMSDRFRTRHAALQTTDNVGA